MGGRSRPEVICGDGARVEFKVIHNLENEYE